MRRQLILCIGLLALLGSPAALLAAPRSAPELYAEGLKLYALEDYAQAATVFERSYLLDEQQSTLFAWAQAERLQQHCDKASELFEKYIGKGEEAKQLKAAFQLIKQCAPPEDKTVPKEPPQFTSTGLDRSGQDTGIEKIESQPSHVPLYRRWQVFAGGSLLAIAGGSYLGLRAQSVANDAELLPDGSEFSTVQKLEDRAENRALLANISFAGAGLLGVAAVWMFLTPSERPDKNKVSITPSIRANEVGLRWSRRF